MVSFDTDDIKQFVTIQDVVERYCGLHPARNGRVPCPFHNGKDNNMALYDDGRYYCYVCGASGDQITFVRNMFNVDFITACKMLNQDFGLGLAIDRELTGFEKREMEKKRKQKQQLKEFVQNATKWRQIELEKAELLYVTCDKILTRMNPKKLGNKISPLWIWATHNIAAAEYYYNRFR